MYLATSFLVPGLCALLAAGMWVLVINRMTNIKIRLSYRIATAVWVFLQLVMPVIDLNRQHLFDTHAEIWVTVCVQTAVKLCNFCIAIWVYRLLGMAYPVRIALSPKEPASALTSTEAFMADSKAHPCLLEFCTPYEAAVAESKVKSKEIAVVVKQTVAAASAAQSVENAAHEAVAAMDGVRSAVGSLTTSTQETK